MSEENRIHAIVKGFVQGIGYRWFVEKEANSLNLTGWVKNLPGGDVELEAEGNRDSLEKFINSLKSKHPWARVNDIDVVWISNGAKTYSDFKIKF